jgi:hypothetical protein
MDGWMEMRMKNRKKKTGREGSEKEKKKKKRKGDMMENFLSKNIDPYNKNITSHHIVLIYEEQKFFLELGASPLALLPRTTTTSFTLGERKKRIQDKSGKFLSWGQISLLLIGDLPHLAQSGSGGGETVLELQDLDLEGVKKKGRKC